MEPPKPNLQSFRDRFVYITLLFHWIFEGNQISNSGPSPLLQLPEIANDDLRRRNVGRPGVSIKGDTTMKQGHNQRI